MSVSIYNKGDEGRKETSQEQGREREKEGKGSRGKYG